MNIKKAENQQIDSLKKEAQDWKEKYLRALADYQNLEKRISKSREEEVKYAAKNILLKVLPVVDALEKASQSINNQGLQLILKQLALILESEKVKRIKVVGEKFNPETM